MGKLIGHACMDNMTRITLELGGKSPVIVLDDCDPAAFSVGSDLRLGIKSSTPIGSKSGCESSS